MKDKDKDISQVRRTEHTYNRALVSVSYNIHFFVPRLRGTFELDYIYLRLLFALPVRTSR